LDYCPKVNLDLTNLEQELAKLKEEIRELQRQKAAMADQRLWHEQEIRDVKSEVELLRKASDGQREAQAAEVRKVVGQLAGQLEDMRSENGREHVAIGEIARANEQLRAEAARLKERIEVLEEENPRLSAANEAVK
jgi:chromosome segregation ATPase